MRMGMSSVPMDPDFMDTIVGEQLSSVEFVQDYLQLHFDGPTLTVFVWPIVRSTVREARWGQPGYKDELCARIGHKVSKAGLREGEAVIILFEDSGEIVISLRPEDRVGPEAGHFCAHRSPGDPILEF